MRKSLIIVLIFTLFLEAVGGFLDSRGSACNLAKFANTTFASLFADANNHDHQKQDDHNSESHEIVEIAPEDDYYHGPTLELKAVVACSDGLESYFDFYTGHYPWTLKEIHTPPPKA